MVDRRSDITRSCGAICEGALLDELGTKHTQLWYSKAASLLEEFGALGEAVRAHLRAECWTEATRLLRDDGARVIATEPATMWHDLVPQQMVDEDPWLSMAVARRLAAEGRLREAAPALPARRGPVPRPEGSGAGGQGSPAGRTVDRGTSAAPAALDGPAARRGAPPSRFGPNCADFRWSDAG